MTTGLANAVPPIAKASAGAASGMMQQAELANTALNEVVSAAMP